MAYSSMLGLHILGITIWIGGMFFAYMVLRPAAVTILQGPFRLRLWNNTFQRFFPWVWLSIILVFASGYFILFNLIGGFAKAAAYIHAMHGLGIVMVLIFLHVFFAPYNKLRKATVNEDWEAGAKALSQIRWLILVNLIIGIIIIVTATVGKGLA